MTIPITNMMLLDDNEADTFLCRLIIEESGLVQNLIVFNLAEQALAHMRKNPGERIDAILLDIRMPRMSGFEFIEAALAEFGSDFAKVVVVMLTTSLDSNDRTRARQFSMIKHYFEKPLTLEQLKTVAGIVANPH
jgi:response regulator RpfG family c-di-GMP phosphodiesterase